MTSNGGSGGQDYQAVEANETRRKRINQVARDSNIMPFLSDQLTSKPIFSWPFSLFKGQFNPALSNLNDSLAGRPALRSDN